MSISPTCPQCRQPLPPRVGNITRPCANCGGTARPTPPAAHPRVAPVPTAHSRKPVLFAATAVAVLAAVVGVVVLARPRPTLDAVPTAPPPVAAADPPSVVAPPVVAAPDRPESAELAWKFEYDDAGRVTKTSNPAGEATTFRFEQDAKAGSRKVIREPAGGVAVVFEFDRDGRRTGMTDAYGKVAYEYDAFGRLAAVKRPGTPPIHYAYDDRDRLATFRVGDEYALKYEYDFLGRRAAIDTPAGRVGYEYSAKEGTVRRTLPNGVRTTWHSAPGGRPDRIEHAARDGAVLAGFAYEYRPDGLIRAVKESAPDGENRVTYDYDTVGRLVAASDTRGRKVAYRYDLLGNREEVAEAGKPAVASTFDWAGRLLRHAGERCSHDPAGNVAAYVGSRGPVRLTHSADGQLVSAATAKSMVQCGYDGEGNLVRREADDRPTTFVPDPLAEAWHPLVATDDRGAKMAYLWDGDAPLAERVNGEWRFFLHNHQDSVRCVVDARGKVLERPDYCPFGRPLGDPAEGFRPGFAGLFYDPQSALYMTKARAYDPALGRFLEIDPQHRLPTGSQKDLIAYTYCGGDPVNFVDLDGCDPRQPPPFMKAIPDQFPHAGLNLKPTLPGIPFEQGRWQLAQAMVASERAVPQWFANQAQIWLQRGTPLEGLNAWVSLNTLGGLYGQPANLFQAYVGFAASWIPGNVGRLYGTLRGGASFVSNLAQGNIKSAVLEGLRLPGRFIPGVGDARGLPISKLWGLPLSTKVGIALDLAGRGNRGFNSGQDAIRLASSPSAVGGVSLSGGGHALAGFGHLEGVSFDAHGRLVLIGQGKTDIELPALRLDDVVTVFREVYDHGTAPFVSIDPDPAAPMGPVMNVRHGPTTADTYVGWVLFEADRVMKTYNLGKDNQTGQPFRSKIPGYDAYLKLQFARPTKGDETWERFWIVPAAVTHRLTPDGRTALTQVPLKLRTDAMVLKGGKLVTAPKGQSSPSAQFFTKWFTDNYDKIDRETRSRTPKESGPPADVPVFAELRRLAAIAAVAERLRDQGVPMPGWMRTYPVKPFPFPATTPATTVESEKAVGKDVVRYSIYGGVTLSPPPEAVKTVPSPEAVALAPAVRAAVAEAPALTPIAVGGRQAIALPPTDAVAVGANHLAETDLHVPLAEGHTVRLVRRFDSFHAPADGFGPAWTLDLPRLDQRLGAPTGKPGLRHGYFELDSPLRSATGVFADLKQVPEVNGRLLVPATAGDMLGVADSTDLGFPTHLILFRDGRRWHFDAAGDLVATEELPLRLRFHRDKARRVERIEGTCGPKTAAIRLEYDARGRLTKAIGTDGQSANYGYDADGRLERVTRPGGAVGYEYRDRLVSAVLEDGAPPRRFEYAAGGRLREERRGADAIAYDVAADRAGTRVTARGGRPGTAPEVSEYDARFRPVRRVLGDGTETAWRYPTDGTTEVTTTPPGGPSVIVLRSADGRREEYKVPGAEARTAEFDAAGRLIELRRGSVPVLTRAWHPTGLPAAEADATTKRQYEYRADGTAAGVRLAPATGDGPWVEMKFDAAGRPETVSDDSGAVTTLKYDAAGRPAGTTGPGGDVTITTDEAGRPRTTRASWGIAETIEYDATGGRPKRIEQTFDGQMAWTEFDGGRPTRVRQFDGGESVLTYPAGPDTPPEQVRTPNGLAVQFDYDAKKRVRKVRCGDAYWVEYEFDAKDRLVGLRLTAAR